MRRSSPALFQKACLITGGNEWQRQEKCADLILKDRWKTHIIQNNRSGEIGLFTHDGKNPCKMTLDEIRAAARSNGEIIDASETVMAKTIIGNK